jgi:hypothetical protein
MTAKIDSKDIVLIQGPVNPFLFNLSEKDEPVFFRIKGRKDTPIPIEFMRENAALAATLLRIPDLVKLYREVIKFNQYIEFKDLPNK